MKLKDSDLPNNIRKFDENIFIEELMNSVDTFSEQMQLMINEALKHAVNKVDFFHIYEWLLDPIKRRMPKVSLDTFLNDRHYLWLKTRDWEWIYDQVRIICREVIEWAYTQAIELAWIWSWKSFSSQIMACYQAHHLLCLRDPHENYKVVADKPITIMNMWVTSTQALEVVFSGIKSFIYWSDGSDWSPFFMQFRPEVQQTAIRFKKERILMASWNSKATTPLWYNVFCAILDEAAFYLDNDEQSVAKDIFDSLQARIISRFWKWVWLIMAISSPRYEWDFITEMIAKSRELWPYWKRKYGGIYSVQLPTWKAKWEKNIDMEWKFYFDVRRWEVIEWWNPTKLEAEWRNINYILWWPITSDYDVREVSWDFLVSFQQNPEKAKRDFWATPSASIAWFFSNPKKVTDMFDMEIENPVVSPWVYKFKNRPLRVPYFIHIDIWFNRDWKWDHAGFCMWHFGWWEKDETANEYRMRFCIDLTERIWITEDTGEVDLSEIRQRIYTLKDMWYAIKLITFDQFASKDFRQIIEKKWFRTDYLSVDRDTWPYDILKAAVYEDRIDIPYDAVVERELRQLELVKWTKVDHPPSGCFTWDTRIALANWTCPTFEELCKQEWPFYVYSIGKTQLEIVEAVKPRITKYTDELVEILLDNYQTIRCTPDHKFMTLAKDWIQAKDLTPEVSIMPLYRSISLTGWWREWYERVWDTLNNKRVMTHHLMFPNKKAGYHIHHKDENKLNNYPTNLEEISSKHHTSLHSKKEWVAKKEAMNKWHTEYYKDDSKREEQRLRILKSWEDWKFWPRAKCCSIVDCDRISNAKGMCDMHYQKNKRARLKAERQSKQVNHRIISIKSIKLEIPVAVYDISVPWNENFALASWVFVHNSKDVSDALAGVCWNISEYTPRSSISVQNLVPNNNSEGNAMAHYRAIKEKEKYYERITKQVQKQMEMEQRVELIRRNMEIKANNLTFM